MAKTGMAKLKKKKKEITKTNVDVKSLPFTIVNYATVNVHVHNKT
jgi:hypothetical protein